MKKFIRRFVCILLCVMACVNTAQASTAASHTHTLKYSIYKSTPSNFREYNCYNYVIGQNMLTDPGQISHTQPSNFKYGSFEKFEECILRDMQRLGYSARVVDDPNTKFADKEYMIAYWYGNMEIIEDIDVEDFNPTTYHFWRKLSNDDPWMHKYGESSGIMEYIGTPSDTTIGLKRITNEMCNSTLSACSQASHRAISGEVGYMIINQNVITSRSFEPIHDIPEYHTGELDHSAGAIYGPKE